MHKVTDLELIESAINYNNQEAYTLLYNRYEKAVKSFLKMMIKNESDAEDVQIQAFSKAFKNLERYNPQYKFSTWVYRIATNCAIDFIRKKRVKVVDLQDKYEDRAKEESKYYASSNLNPEEQVIYSDLIARCIRAANQLSDKHKAIFEMRFLKNYSYKEIADELQIPLGSVKGNLFRARQDLKNLLGVDMHYLKDLISRGENRIS